MGGSDLGALKKGDLVWAMHDIRSWLPARFKARVQGKLQVSSEEKKSDGSLVWFRYFPSSFSLPN